MKIHRPKWELKFAWRCGAPCGSVVHKRFVSDLWTKRFVNKAPIWGAETSRKFQLLFWLVYPHDYSPLLWIKCHSNDSAWCRETSIQQTTGHGKITVKLFLSVSAFNLCMLTTNIGVTNLFSTFVLAATLINDKMCLLHFLTAGVNELGTQSFARQRHS